MSNRTFTVLFIIVAMLLNILIAGIVYTIWVQNAPAGDLSDNTADLERVYIGNNTLVGTSCHYHPRFQTLGVMVSEVIHCESSWDNSARGEAGEIGLCQFKQETWDWMCKLAGFNGDIYSEEDQLWMINWAFENGFQGHWTCWKLLTNK